MRYAASAVLELKYLPLGTKISNLCTQKAALHEAIVLPALRPDLFQGIRTPPKVLRRASRVYIYICILLYFFLFQGICLRRCSGALVASALLVLKYLLTVVLKYLLTNTKVHAYFAGHPDVWPARQRQDASRKGREV